jgi:MraZ protein
MFRGHYEHTVDDKGRVAIPARFREVLSGLQEGCLVVTKFVLRGRRCLDVYPLGAWRELEARLLGTKRFDQRLAEFRNYYVSGATECLLDSQGRILLPQLLRGYAGLKRDAMFTGDIDKFRIWDRDTWQEVFAAHEQAFLESPERWDEIDL